MEEFAVEVLCKEDSHRGVAPFLAAAWGVCFAWCPAVFVAALVTSGRILPPAILGAPYTTKSVEKIFFVTFYIAATILAFLSARFCNVFRNPRNTAIAVLIFIPFAPWLASVAIIGGPFAYLPLFPPLDPRTWSDFAGSVKPVIFWLALPIFALAVPFVGRIGATNVRRFNGVFISLPLRVLPSWKFVTGASACILLFAACLLPGDVETVAARIGYNMHPISFYVAPAMFAKAYGLIPGVDYFPQYGIGIGYLFSYFLRPTVLATIENSVFVTSGLSLFYFASALIVLNRLYRSLIVAMAVVLFAMLLTFHTPTDQRLAVFMEPSTWPVRYPFFFVFVYLMSLAVERRRFGYLAAGGAAAGLGLFWNTETGLYMTATASVATIFFAGSLKRAALDTAVMLAGAAGFFCLLASIAYGPGIVQTGFFVGLLKPLTVYEAGFGAVVIAWNSPLNIVVACLSPVIGFATIGWAAAMALREQGREVRGLLVILFLLACFQNCLMIKWINMSYSILWQVNALPILAVGAWWIQTGVRYVRQVYPGRAARIGMRVSLSALALALVAVLCFVRDDQDPTKYALQAFVIYPSVLLANWPGIRHKKWDPAGEASDADVSLLRRCTATRDRVAIVAERDWVYYLASGRTPEIPWLPITTISAFPFLVKDAVLQAGPIFIDRRISVQSLEEPLRTILKDRLESDYDRGPAGKILKVMLRKDRDRTPVASRDCLASSN